MILLINVLLTDDVLNQDTFRYQRGFLDYPYRPHKYDKIDIFKYTLASYAVIPWTKVLIFCELDNQYKAQKEEIQQFVEKEFNGQDVKLEFYRNSHQKDWQKLFVDEIENKDNLIWFCCNHDHPFIDYDLTVLERGIKLLSERQYPASIYFSYWSELLNKASYIHNERPGPVDVYDKYVGFQLINNNDSIQIINQALYKLWWFEEDYGDAFLPRSDYRLADKDGNPIGYDIRKRHNMLNHYCFVPLREMCRHYDGYGHVSINPNKCPALVIPPGFFERNVTIRFEEFSKYNNEYVNVDPSKLYYSIIDKNGTDYKWLAEDIPLFWKKYIKQIDDYNRDTFAEDRNEALYDIGNASMGIFGRHLFEQTWYQQWEKLNYR